MNDEKKRLNPELSIFILQASVIFIIILAVLAVRLINGDWFDFLKGFYIGRFSSDTSVNEVIDTEIDDESNVIHLSNAVEVISAVKTPIEDKNYKNKLTVPVETVNMTSGYGYRTDPIDGGIEFHKGIDLAAPKGSGIFASASGMVELSKYSNSYGYYMIINHGGGLKTLYAHCSELLKQAGDTVSSGELVAKIGSTGRSTGPHLHFEVILNGNNLNPEWLISK